MECVNFIEIFLSIPRTIASLVTRTLKFVLLFWHGYRMIEVLLQHKPEIMC